MSMISGNLVVIGGLDASYTYMLMCEVVTDLCL